MSRTAKEFRKEFKAIRIKRIELRNELINQFKRLCKAYPDVILVQEEDVAYKAIDFVLTTNLSTVKLIKYIKLIEKHIESKYKQLTLF